MNSLQQFELILKNVLNKMNTTCCKEYLQCSDKWEISKMCDRIHSKLENVDETSIDMSVDIDILPGLSIKSLLLSNDIKQVKSCITVLKMAALQYQHECDVVMDNALTVIDNPNPVVSNIMGELKSGLRGLTDFKLDDNDTTTIINTLKESLNTDLSKFGGDDKIKEMITCISSSLSKDKITDDTDMDKYIQNILNNVSSNFK